ncbi:hypothetical protein ACLIBG_12075 [Virgibacillus sp. W0181]|uniref:hypothetical protein n=1 Tax=Virgibacillus sp. W0181 TaxID=3391581 RepID=UPI003F445A75
MNRKQKDEQIIQAYQDDERMMILIYAQWCINNDLDPVALYNQAYPNQLRNDALIDALELTVSKQESEQIENQTVLNILQIFGNDNLAFIVQNEIEKRERK